MWCVGLIQKLPCGGLSLFQKCGKFGLRIEFPRLEKMWVLIVGVMYKLSLILQTLLQGITKN